MTAPAAPASPALHRTSAVPLFGVETEPGFVVELEAFTGPLDLLLHLLREQQIEISEIPIARIADQFLAAIHDLGLNQAADYLEMASRLVRLKVQLLLPRPGDEGWEDPRAELVRRLLEYQQVKEIAQWLERAADRRALQFARGYLPAPPELPPPPLALDLADVLAAVERVIAGILHPVLHSVIARPLDVEGATLRLEILLAEREEFVWTQALGPRPTIVDVLSLLLALLELARRGVLVVRQPGPFTALVLCRDAARPAH